MLRHSSSATSFLASCLHVASACPAHSLHCTDLIKSVLFLTLHQAPSDGGCEPSVTGPQPTYPASPGFSIPPLTQLNRATCGSARAFPHRQAFARAALPAWGALSHPACWLHFCSVFQMEFKHHFSGKPFLKLPDRGLLPLRPSCDYSTYYTALY